MSMIHRHVVDTHDTERAVPAIDPEVERLGTENAELRARVARFEQGLADYQKRLREVRKDNEALERANAELRREVMRLRSESAGRAA